MAIDEPPPDADDDDEEEEFVLAPAVEDGDDDEDTPFSCFLTFSTNALRLAISLAARVFSEFSCFSSRCNAWEKPFTSSAVIDCGELRLD